MCEPSDDQIVPLPWKEIPPSTEPLTTVRYVDVMHTVLEQCWGLAEVCSVAAMQSVGMPDGLLHALAILEEYSSCALALYERWQETQHAGPVVREEEALDDLGRTASDALPGEEGPDAQAE